MNTSYVAPERDKTPFHCPHCEVVAQQVWKPLFWEELVHYTKPSSYGGTGYLPEVDEQEEGKVSLDLDNDDMLAVAECQNCKGLSIWLYDTMLYPDGYAPPPNYDLNDDIKRDYLEARSIVTKSPRGAAALLRLCIDKMCVHLGAKGKNLDQKIAYLVKEKNLPKTIQQAFDTVRVIGNEAVHPGTMDLGDDRTTAMSLFELTNLVADKMITEPKQIQGLYDRLPDTKRQWIEERDKRKEKKNVHE